MPSGLQAQETELVHIESLPCDLEQMTCRFFLVCSGHWIIVRNCEKETLVSESLLSCQCSRDH